MGGVDEVDCETGEGVRVGCRCVSVFGLAAAVMVLVFIRAGVMVIRELRGQVFGVRWQPSMIAWLGEDCFVVGNFGLGVGDDRVTVAEEDVGWVNRPVGCRSWLVIVGGTGGLMGATQ